VGFVGGAVVIFNAKAAKLAGQRLQRVRGKDANDFKSSMLINLIMLIKKMGFWF
jgi:hypothetical protein